MELSSYNAAVEENIFWQQRYKVAELMQDFQPDPRSKKLSGFLGGLFCYCDDFMENYENDQFSDAMQNGFLNFQKALNEE